MERRLPVTPVRMSRAPVVEHAPYAWIIAAHILGAAAIGLLDAARPAW